MKRLLRDFLNSVLIILGIFSASMGLKGFLLSSNFIDGGVTGVSMLLAMTTGLFIEAGIGLATMILFQPSWQLWYGFRRRR